MGSAHQAYNDIEISSEVLTASNHRLVQMLLERCLQQIYFAKTAIENNNLEGKRHAISRAADVVSYLRLCLNFDDAKARVIAEQLDALYEYVTKSFLQATLKNDATFLDQAYQVLSNIKEGWDGIAPAK